MSWTGAEDIFLSTSLASYLDKKLLVLLRDGRKLMGLLRSFDQFANVILEGACERVIVGHIYCDIPLGLYVIRGENVVLIGELDLDKEDLPPHMTQVSEEEIKRCIHEKCNASGVSSVMQEVLCHFFGNLITSSLQAQKAVKDATELKGSMRKRMEFLDFD